MKKIHKAFTLIEMVIVLFIISLLLLIMIPNLVAQKIMLKIDPKKHLLQPSKLRRNYILITKEKYLHWVN